jgi:hypothetical protein
MREGVASSRPEKYHAMRDSHVRRQASKGNRFRPIAGNDQVMRIVLSQHLGKGTQKNRETLGPNQATNGQNVGTRVRIRQGIANFVHPDAAVDHAPARSQRATVKRLGLGQRMSRASGNDLGIVDGRSHDTPRQLRALKQTCVVAAQFSMKAQHERDSQPLLGADGIIGVGADTLNVNQLGPMFDELMTNHQQSHRPGDISAGSLLEIRLRNAEDVPANGNALVSFRSRQRFGMPIGHD